MTYVTAGLCGDKERYSTLVDKIRLGEHDTLYVIGDVVDYGAGAMDLLTEMSMSPNVFPVAGAHDLRALRMLTGFEKMLKSGESPTAAYAEEMNAWVSDGGMDTLGGYRALDAEMREGALDYLAEFTLFEEVEAAGKEYVLVYAGIADFDAEKPLEEYTPAQFFTPAPRGSRYFEDRTLIVGGTPTESGRIERENGVIYLNCGVRTGGALGCLCLETGEEFYV